ncbi:MAG: hypothetical protein IKN02_03515 [Prevotella sp.]|nr:hypothetical protein [Prevotella sp.]
MDTIQLSDICIGTPGITPVEGVNLYENSIVALHNSGHVSPVTLRMEGLRTEPFSRQRRSAFHAEGTSRSLGHHARDRR